MRYLLLLTSFFLLLEVSFFIQCNRTYFSDYTFMASQLQVPASVLPAIFYFVFAQILLHSAYSVVVFGLSKTTASYFRLRAQDAFAHMLILWGVGIVSLIAANQFFFPNSKFTELSLLFFNRATAQGVWITGLIIFIGHAMIAMKHNRFIRRSSVGVFLLSLSIYFFSNHPPTKNPATTEQPNIFIVGVDSLRPDFVHYFGRNIQTPFMDRFLQSAYIFKEAMTPLARTFPSWTAILTGQSPTITGVRTNLSNQARAHLAAALPIELEKMGYETAYASDETRFSNISHTYGFQQLLTPPMGLNDFLLGTLNDFPLSNLIINTTLGKWLFPYSFANRPAYFVYEPNSFLALLKPYLYKQKERPLFLAIHFCLPHYPYLWSALDGRKYEAIPRYEKSIEQVDLQLQAFFNLLQNAHLLDHAIVVLLSDHGEALALPGDLLAKHEDAIGHGTDVLSLTQYHTVLAFKSYHASPIHPGQSEALISLTCIKSHLLNLLQKKPLQQSSEMITIESDFTPEAIKTIYPDMEKVALEGIQLFEIDPKTTKLTVKEAMYQKIMASKQYAVLKDQWILARYPKYNAPPTWILVNRKTGQWTTDLHSALAHQAPVATMLKALTEVL